MRCLCHYSPRHIEVNLEDGWYPNLDSLYILHFALFSCSFLLYPCPISGSGCLSSLLCFPVASPLKSTCFPSSLMLSFHLLFGLQLFHQSISISIAHFTRFQSSILHTAYCIFLRNMVQVTQFLNRPAVL